MSIAAIDETLALRKVLQDCQMSTTTADHIIGMDTSIALLANAVGADSNLEDFVKHVSPVPEWRDFPAVFSPDGEHPQIGQGMFGPFNVGWSGILS